MVLGGRPDHRGTADVDLLHALWPARAAGDRLGERIQVRDQQLERRDPEPGKLSDVLGVAQVGQQAGVHGRMQCLDPAAQTLGKSGQRLNRRDGNPGGADSPGRAAGRDDLDRGPVQRAGQPVQARLVVDADERPADGNLAHCCDPPDPPILTVRPLTHQPFRSMATTVSASRARSTDLIRSVSVSSSSSSRTLTAS